MPILDPDARAVALSALVGTSRAAVMPASYTVHLFDGDPAFDGTEIANTTETEEGTVPNGYAAGTVSADDFTLDGEVATAFASMPATLAEYPADVTHFVMRSGGLDWFAAPLLETLTVTGAGDPFLLGISLFFDSFVELSV